MIPPNLRARALSFISLTWGIAAKILNGFAGYTKHHQVERYWRDARLTKIFEGTSEIQQRIISDNLLGRVRE